MVVPSRQRAHALRVAYADAQLLKGLRVWPSVDVLPLEGWLTREIERAAAAEPHPAQRLPRLLSGAEEWLLWRECTAEAAEQFDLVNGAALAESLHRTDRLAAQLQLDLGKMRAPPGTEMALFLQVHRAVEARARAVGAASVSVMCSRVAPLGDARPVLLAGFLNSLSPSPQLRALAQARRASGCETLWAPRPQPPAPRPAWVMPADELEELDRIAQWCRDRLVEQPRARVLVVLPGSSGRRERLAALIEQALDPQRAFDAGAQRGGLIAVEGGGSLTERPAVAHALASLGLLCGEVLDIEQLTQWLLAPFWSEPTLEGRARLQLWLSDRAGLALELKELRAALAAAPEPLAATARACAARIEQARSVLAPAADTPREWSERFRDALRLLGWPGARAPSSGEQQTLLRWHALLDEFGQLSSVLGAHGRRVALTRLREFAAHTAYRPADEDAVVTVTAALADPVVSYEGVWVAGLHAEAFPQPPAPDPFLPLGAQRAAGAVAASAEGRLAEAHALLAAWRATAGELVLSAPRRSEDLELLPSPLLWGGFDAAATAAPAVREPLWLGQRAHRAGLLEPWTDAGVAWDTREPLPGGTRSLELQNQCPFRAYAELRLGCAELPVSEPGVTAEFRGRFLHAALQRLWSGLRDSGSLAAIAPEALQERIGRGVAQALEALLAGPGTRPSEAALLRERRRAERLIGQLLDLERQRPAFSVRAAELAVELDLGGIRLRGRVDRVDSLEGGGLAVLDYKSGRPVSADWYGARPSHPQLLAYLAALGDEVTALATVNVTAREVRFQGIAAQAGLLPGVAAVQAADGAEPAWTARVREWRGLVQRLARDFAAGAAGVDPKPRACEHCAVSGVCRIGDLPADDDPERDT